MPRELFLKPRFTWYELLVIFAILAILIGMVLPGIQRTHVLTSEMQCQMNVHQLLIAVHNYAALHDDALPACYSAPHGAVYNAGPPPQDTYPQSLLFTLLPFVEQRSIYEAGMDPATKGQTWNGHVDDFRGAGPIFNHGRVNLYRCPSDPALPAQPTTPNGWIGAGYAFNYQVFGTQNWAPRYDIRHIPDGTANTVALAERFAHFPGPLGQFTDPAGVSQQAGNLWAWPAGCGTSPPTSYKAPLPQHATIFAYGNVSGASSYGYGPVVFDSPQFDINPSQADYRRVQSGHKHRMMLGMCDGSCRSVAAGISQTTWQSVLLPADGVAPGKDW